MGPKLMKIKNYGFQKILGYKNLSPEKILDPGKFLVMKNFRSFKKNLGHENFGSWKIIDHKKKSSVWKIYKRFLITENFVSQKILGSKKFWVPKNVGSQNFLNLKNFELQKNFGSQNFWSKWNFGPDKIWVLKELWFQ